MVSVRRVARSPITWALTVVLVIVLGVGLALFEPWRLFTDKTVTEAAPTVAVSGTPKEPRPLARGSFISHEHDTSGTIVILRLDDGSRMLWCVRFHVSFGAAQLRQG